MNVFFRHHTEKESLKARHHEEEIQLNDELHRLKEYQQKLCGHGDSPRFEPASALTIPHLPLLTQLGLVHVDPTVVSNASEPASHTITLGAGAFSRYQRCDQDVNAAYFLTEPDDAIKIPHTGAGEVVRSCFTDGGGLAVELVQEGKDQNSCPGMVYSVNVHPGLRCHQQKMPSGCLSCSRQHSASIDTRLAATCSATSTHLSSTSGTMIAGVSLESSPEDGCSSARYRLSASPATLPECRDQEVQTIIPSEDDYNLYETNFHQDGGCQSRPDESAVEQASAANQAETNSSMSFADGIGLYLSSLSSNVQELLRQQLNCMMIANPMSAGLAGKRSLTEATIGGGSGQQMSCKQSDNPMACSTTWPTTTNTTTKTQVETHTPTLAQTICVTEPSGSGTSGFAPVGRIQSYPASSTISHSSPGVTGFDGVKLANSETLQPLNMAMLSNILAAQLNPSCRPPNAGLLPDAKPAVQIFPTLANEFKSTVDSSPPQVMFSQYGPIQPVYFGGPQHLSSYYGIPLGTGTEACGPVMFQQPHPTFSQLCSLYQPVPQSHRFDTRLSAFPDLCLCHRINPSMLAHAVQLLQQHVPLGDLPSAQNLLLAPSVSSSAPSQQPQPLEGHAQFLQRVGSVATLGQLPTGQPPPHHQQTWQGPAPCQQQPMAADRTAVPEPALPSSLPASAVPQCGYCSCPIGVNAALMALEESLRKLQPTVARDALLPQPSSTMVEREQLPSLQFSLQHMCSTPAQSPQKLSISATTSAPSSYPATTQSTMPAHSTQQQYHQQQQQAHLLPVNWHGLLPNLLGQLIWATQCPSVGVNSQNAVFSSLTNFGDIPASTHAVAGQDPGIYSVVGSAFADGGTAVQSTVVTQPIVSATLLTAPSQVQAPTKNGTHAAAHLSSQCPPLQGSAAQTDLLSQLQKQVAP